MFDIFLSLSLKFSGTNLSFSSDIAVAGLWSDPLAVLVSFVWAKYVFRL